MSNCRPCLAVDCPTDDPYGLYSLQSEIFPFVLNCPPGYNCRSGGGYFVTFIACEGSLVTRWIPPGSTSAEYDAIISEMMSDLQRILPSCLPSGNGGPLPTQLYWNQPQTCTALCPDNYPFTYTVPAGRYAAFSLAQANAATYALDSGSLPTGVSLNATGLISGTPTGGLPATFVVAVTVT